ncbi:MAG: molybdopterin molybdotransferase MoeA [Actinomycetota bacterium]|nr:molybdopterin molybdotransferase MoeA [Actinomycetota bacterium]
MPDDLASVEDHLARILDDVAPLPSVEVPLMDSLGLSLAGDMTSAVSLPRFDNSAMDGYAVRVADLGDLPATLPVSGEIGAGQSGVTLLAPGTAAKIMTGAPVPSGADAIVPYEWTDRGATTVVIEKAPALGQHVRAAGEDVRAGDVVLPAGTVLEPRHLGLLASIGHASVPCGRRPRVVVVSTGSELREPGAELAADSIYEGNSYLLAGAALRAGAEVHRLGIVPDDPDAFLATLREALPGADVVVTSGGVSQGDYDVVKAALRPLGTMWFGGVAMQPGKPQGYGRVDGVPVFTLPGNPVSSYISFQVFVLPALHRMLGRATGASSWRTARLAEPVVSSPAGRRQFLRGVLRDGELHQVGGPGSHLIAALAASDALIIVPEEATSLAAGDEVRMLSLDGVR